GAPLSPLAFQAYLRVTRAPRFPWYYVRRIEKAVGGPNPWLPLYGLMTMSKLRFYSRDMWEALGDHLPYEDLRLNHDRMRRWHPLHRGIYLGARVLLPGLLLQAKGDRVAMHSSVETRYPFLDEDVFAFLAQLHPRWKLRGFRDKYLLRRIAERWLPREIARRSKFMFRAPDDNFDLAGAPPYVNQLMSDESLRKTGYFDPEAVRHWRQAYRTMRRGVKRTMIELGLSGVFTTQLWHQIYLDPTLADVPDGRSPVRFPEPSGNGSTSAALAGPGVRSARAGS